MLAYSVHSLVINLSICQPVKDLIHQQLIMEVWDHTSGVCLQEIIAIVDSL